MPFVGNIEVYHCIVAQIGLTFLSYMNFFIIIIIIIIIMYMKCLACSLFLDPQDEVGPSISSWVVLCSFVPLVYIVI